MQNGLKTAITAAGGMRKLARLLGLSHASVQEWSRVRKIPADRLLKIERVTGVPREVLRPDLYRGYARVDAPHSTTCPADPPAG